MTAPELSLRFGHDCPLQIVMLQPLFEEYNRCRRLLCEMGRALERDGIGLCLGDLSGMGESETPIAEVSMARWHEDAASIVKSVSPTVIASLRGGALFDSVGEVQGRWRFAPETGARVVRDLRRTALTGQPGLFGGHVLSESFVAELERAMLTERGELRTVRLENDALPADSRIAGSPLWRRAEPGDDPSMAEAMASDLAAFTRQCAAS